MQCGWNLASKLIDESWNLNFSFTSWVFWVQSSVWQLWLSWCGFLNNSFFLLVCTKPDWVLTPSIQRAELASCILCFMKSFIMSEKINNLEILATKFYLGVFLIPSFKLSKNSPWMLEAKWSGETWIFCFSHILLCSLPSLTVWQW